MSRINFHGPKDVRAIEVLLYNVHIFHKRVESENICGFFFFFFVFFFFFLFVFENFEIRTPLINSMENIHDNQKKIVA